MTFCIKPSVTDADLARYASGNLDPRIDWASCRAFVKACISADAEVSESEPVEARDWIDALDALRENHVLALPGESHSQSSFFGPGMALAGEEVAWVDPFADELASAIALALDIRDWDPVADVLQRTGSVVLDGRAWGFDARGRIRAQELGSNEQPERDHRVFEADVPPSDDEEYSGAGVRKLRSHPHLPSVDVMAVKRLEEELVATAGEVAWAQLAADPDDVILVADMARLVGWQAEELTAWPEDRHAMRVRSMPERHDSTVVAVERDRWIVGELESPSFLEGRAEPVVTVAPAAGSLSEAAAYGLAVARRTGYFQDVPEHLATLGHGTAKEVLAHLDRWG